MLTFAVKKKRIPSIAPKRHASTVSPMSHSLHVQQAKVRHILQGPTLQPKLTIGQPNDKYEQEADRIADEVMRMPEPGVQRQVEPEEEEEEVLQAKPLAGQITPLVQRQPDPVEEEEEEEELIQPKSNTGMAPQVTPGIAHDIQSFKGTGQPLPTSERAFFEPRFGANFGNVRVHSDARAAHVARSINARAFTLGHDVVFGAGRYSPGNSSGRKLFAHELTHVIQQNGRTNVRLQAANGSIPSPTSTPWQQLPQEVKKTLEFSFAHFRHQNSKPWIWNQGANTAAGNYNKMVKGKRGSEHHRALLTMHKAMGSRMWSSIRYLWTINPKPGIVFLSRYPIEKQLRRDSNFCREPITALILAGLSGSSFASVKYREVRGSGLHIIPGPFMVSAHIDQVPPATRGVNGECIYSVGKTLGHMIIDLKNCKTRACLQVARILRPLTFQPWLVKRTPLRNELRRIIRQEKGGLPRPIIFKLLEFEF